MILRSGAALDTVGVLAGLAGALSMATGVVLTAVAFRMTQTAVIGLNLLNMFQALRILDDAYKLDDIATHTGRYDVIIALVGNQPIRALRHALTSTGAFVVVDLSHTAEAIRHIATGHGTGRTVVTT